MIFNFGSINIDHVYQVPHLPEPGETLSASSVSKFLGGKGVNQSISIARAQGEVIHIGAVGPDGDWALEKIAGYGVSTEAIARITEPTGHAIINVDAQGENAIVIFPGANACLTEKQVLDALKDAGPNDWVLLQNETNLAEFIVEAGKARRCKICYSAAPFIAETTLALLPQTDLLVVNEGEAASLASAIVCEPEALPVPWLLITKGSNGVFLKTPEKLIDHAAFKVKPVDTTGAGDTFLGSFLGRLAQGDSEEAAIEYATAASAIQVTRHGAADAIPGHNEVLDFLKKNGI